MKKIPFGALPGGAPVEQYTLSGGGLECDILTYGGILRSLRVPGRDGQTVDVLLGFDTLESYLAKSKFMGALVGRYANRIAGAAFDLNGVHYPLAANSRTNHIHGGRVGFDKQIWTVETAEDNALTLSLVSPDGQEGYPGTLKVQVTYRLENGGLTLEYRAKSDRDTLCNLTNHAYFNLSGHASGPVLDQEIQMMSDAYTPIDAASIPTGALSAVDGSPMDLRSPVPIGAHIDDDDEQLRLAGGYDHNWVVRGQPGTLRPAAVAYSPGTGVAMETLTTQPGVQFYAGNTLDGCPAGKGGARYANRCGFCLETQAYPDSPHHPDFPSAVLRAGEEYRQTTVYRFSVRQAAPAPGAAEWKDPKEAL